MIRRPPRSTRVRSSAASDVYKRQKIFILDEPTRGIDVGTKVEVHTIIKKLADEGMAIIFISSDLPEVIAMSDRILVMREGRQMGIVESNNFTQETIMSLAMGENIGDS